MLQFHLTILTLYYIVFSLSTSVVFSSFIHCHGSPVLSIKAWSFVSSFLLPAQTACSMSPLSQVSSLQGCVVVITICISLVVQHDTEPPAALGGCFQYSVPSSVLAVCCLYVRAFYYCRAVRMTLQGRNASANPCITGCTINKCHSWCSVACHINLVK